MIIYVVKSGDTLFNIAKKFNIELNKIISDNQLSQPDNLVVGQDLIIDINSIPHIAVKGDSLYSIAKNYGVSLQNLITANPQLENPDYIKIGEQINVPISQEKRDIEVNGYAIANINTQVLNNTLSYLTYLSIFSYQAREDGRLYILYEQSLIDNAIQNSVTPIMVVTNIGMSGSFESELAHNLFTNSDAQETLINNILSTMQRKNYYGVNIDFEYLYPEDKQNYVNFLANLKSKLEPLNYILTVALAPKYSDNQQGILYEAHDYKQIGAIADRVILMTYEWGYVYGPPQAVSPYSEIKKVLSYAVTVIPSNKILMGFSNYAYDWTLPYVQGEPARALSNNSALELAINTKSTIYFDEKSQSPYFNYKDENNNNHVVWFENARSIQSRLSLVNDFNLAGISFWTINSFFNANYLILSNMFNIIKLL